MADVHPSVVLLLCAADLLTAAVMDATVRAGSSDRSKPNSISGIRTAATMASPAAWRAGHRAALPAARAASAWCAGAAVLGLVLLVPGWTVAAFVTATHPSAAS